METDTAIEQLETLGLHVMRSVPSALADSDSSKGFTVAKRIIQTGEIRQLDQPCWIYPIQDSWVYRNWNGIGGRAPDDVEFKNLTLEQAVKFAEDFYFGVPLTVDGWIFPVQKHPDWTVSRILKLYADAVPVQTEDWLRLKASREGDSQGRDNSAQFNLRFREIESNKPNPTHRLWIRNDLEEAYRVR